MSSKKVFLILILTISLLFSMTGCKGRMREVDNRLEKNDVVEEKKEYKPEEGGELVVPLTIISTLNPLISENISYHYFSKLIFEGLFQLDNKLNIENVLAEDYNILDGGRIIDIELRDDVYWHDGEKFTAEDVSFTINTIKYASNETVYKKMLDNVLNTYNISDVRRILDAKIIDDYNIQIIFDRSYSNGLETLTFPIIPKHVFNGGTEEKNAYNEALKIENYKPIGTGPYKFFDYEKLKSIKLEANEEWWKGKTNIKAITGKILEDEELILTAFETDQVDLTVTTGVDWEKYSQSKRVKINEFVSNNYEFLAFNFNNKFFKDGQNEAIRRAMAYGINRQAIIEQVYLGHGTQIDVPIHPESWLISEKANLYGYNLSKAKQELEKAGWKDRDGDGICEDEKGNKLSFRLTTNSHNPLRVKTANMIAEDLNKIGIEVVKDYVDEIPDDITEEMIEKQWEQFKQKIERGDFDIALLGWQLSSIPELSFAFHSSQIKYGTNCIRYTNEEMDKLLVQAFNASTREAKKKSYERLEDLIVKDLPYMSLFFRNKALLSSKKVQGNIKPQFFNIYYNIEEWFIPKEYQK